MALVTYPGGCHCGAVRFEVDVAADAHVAHDCNCSMCHKSAYLHVIVPRERFRLLQGAEAIRTYTFNTGVARHTFCRICGVKSFYTPRSHPDGISANLRCFDGDARERFTIEPFDGRNWEAAIDTIR